MNELEELLSKYNEKAEKIAYEVDLVREKAEGLKFKEEQLTIQYNIVKDFVDDIKSKIKDIPVEVEYE